jgi:hypothetical protein
MTAWMSTAVSNAGVRPRPVDGEAELVGRSTSLCEHEVSGGTQIWLYCALLSASEMPLN